jgi:hypothetical protein
MDSETTSRSRLAVGQNPYGPVTGGEEEGGVIGKGATKAGISGDELILVLASLIFGHRSKLAVRLRKAAFALTIPRVSRSVLLAPEPLSIHRKL